MLPCTLGDIDVSATIPAGTIKVIHSLKLFIAENSKSARKFLKSANHPLPQNEIVVNQINKHDPTEGVPDAMQMLTSGVDIGFLSEAGLPGVADPGAIFARKAHELNIPVHSLTGPSSLLLALSASGMNGQSFSFHGYLPKEPEKRKVQIRQLESDSKKEGSCKIFIETPYRNRALFDSIIEVCGVGTLLCVASNLTLEDQYIKTLSIKSWKNNPPDINKKPTVFILEAQ